jgi:cytochrome c
VKKTLLTTALFAGLLACNSNTSSESSTPAADTATSAPATATEDLSANPDYQAGLAVVAKNDCGTCHEISTKKIGPAFKDIAVKYSGAGEAVIDSLAGKVIKGGTGVWGQVPMTPHSAMTVDDAKAAVKYVLLLKNS